MKTTIQKLHCEGLFVYYDYAGDENNEVFERRRGTFQKTESQDIEVYFQKIYSKHSKQWIDIKIKNPTSPFFYSSFKTWDLSNARSNYNKFRISKFAPRKSNTKSCLNRSKVFWFIWMYNTGETNLVFKKTISFLLIFWIQNPEVAYWPSATPPPQNEFLIVSLVAYEKVIWPELGKRFYINCFENILPTCLPNVLTISF